MKYSVFSLARNALSGHKNWQPAWRSPDPKPEYDVIIVGGGGHGLATAYYLAKNCTASPMWRCWRRAIWAAAISGATPPSSAPNYLLPGNNPFYEKSLQLVGRPGAGLQFQRHGLATRRHQPVPFRFPARRLHQARQRHAHSRSRRRNARPATRCATCCRF